jgi:hypothetical protein
MLPANITVFSEAYKSLLQVTSYKTMVSNASHLILDSSFQNFIQFILLLLAFAAVMLTFNTTFFTYWVDHLFKRYSVLPTKGNWIVFTLLGIGPCIFGTCAIIAWLFLDFSTPCLTICCFLSEILWGLLLGAIVATTFDVLRIGYYLFPI